MQGVYIRKFKVPAFKYLAGTTERIENSIALRNFPSTNRRYLSFIGCDMLLSCAALLLSSAYMWAYHYNQEITFVAAGECDSCRPVLTPSG